jgi:hypothetical protein
VTPAIAHQWQDSQVAGANDVVLLLWRECLIDFLPLFGDFLTVFLTWN